MTINERLKFLRTQIIKLSAEAFGKKIGLTYSAISMMERGKRAVTERTIKSICIVYKVNERWLKTGEGDIFLSEEEILLHNVTEAFSRLKPEYQKIVLKQMDNLLEMQSTDNE